MSVGGSDATRPPCAEECATVVRDGLAERGIEAHVTWVPPLIPSDYESLDMRCPHGVLWFTEPTSEQIARWVEKGTP